jgi:hypothetical protein
MTYCRDGDRGISEKEELIQTLFIVSMSDMAAAMSFTLGGLRE